MINYGKHSISTEDVESVKKTLKSNFLTQGPVVQRFEKKLSEYFNSKYTLAVSSGTSALNIVAKVLNWKKNDSVIVSPITFLATANCIERSGAKPVFVDINLEDYSLDISKLEKKIKDLKKKLKAVIVTDYAGHPADWKKIYRLKKKYNFKVINDNCHAIGSSIDNNRGYAVKYADFSILSFHPVKSITTGEGGAILTNDKKFFQMSKILRSHGVVRDQKKIKKIGRWYHEMREMGSNYRLSDIQAALGLSQLKRIRKFVLRRNYIAKYYDKVFGDNEFFTIPKKRKNIFHSYHLYPLLVNFNKIKKSKKFIFKQFLKHQINLQVHYIPINTQPYYRKKYKFVKKNFQNSLKFYEKEISMPIYFDLTNKQLNYIKKISKKIFKF